MRKPLTINSLVVLTVLKSSPTQAGSVKPRHADRSLHSPKLRQIGSEFRACIMTCFEMIEQWIRGVLDLGRGYLLVRMQPSLLVKSPL